MTTKRRRQERLLTALKVALVGVTALGLVWIVSWLTRSEWLAQAQAEAAAATATPRPTETRESILVLPTVAPLPTERPTFHVRTKPSLAALPTPIPGFTAPSIDSARAVPTFEPAAPSTSSADSQPMQMPELQPIPDLPAPPPQPPPSSGGGGGGGTQSRTRAS